MSKKATPFVIRYKEEDRIWKKTDDAGLEAVETTTRRKALDEAAMRHIKNQMGAKALDAAIDAEFVLNAFRPIARRRRKTRLDERKADNVKAYLKGLSGGEQTRHKRYERLRA